ncbi:hypothetical protein [Variovorax sp. W2I14]|uniref:hypothetical protein n=1 Tax=Variovorax sp. W2I14 TaxID=3042290 RepID=UPI003D1C18CB
MRRLLDPIELEKLAARRDDPLRSPFDLMRDFARALVGLFVVAVFGLTALALALSDMPGVTP